VARDIVVIGASAGGLEALSSLTASLPAWFPAAVMIVLHTGSGSPMSLAKIIGRLTPFTVSYAEQGDTIESGHIYFAPPDHHLSVTPPGSLWLNQAPKENFTRPAVDVLFRSAAAAYGARVIGVVLTGAGKDGTAGLQAIKLAGGLGIVQTPADAAHRGMPMSALQGANPDFCMPLNEIGALLTSLANGAYFGSEAG
jgi:two-component system, chemotaxis family, protein-glutamate methylesterase/glutaminase